MFLLIVYYTGRCKIIMPLLHLYEPISSVSIVTGYGLVDRGSIPYGGGGFFLYPLLPAGSGANPASYTMDTGDLPGDKCGRGVLLTNCLLLEPRVRKERGYNPSPPVRQSWHVTGNLYLFIISLLTNQLITKAVFFSLHPFGKILLTVGYRMLRHLVFSSFCWWWQQASLKLQPIATSLHGETAGRQSLADPSLHSSSLFYFRCWRNRAFYSAVKWTTNQSFSLHAICVIFQ
jgi:hypothetical protein